MLEFLNPYLNIDCMQFLKNFLTFQVDHLAYHQRFPNNSFFLSLATVFSRNWLQVFRNEEIVKIKKNLNKNYVSDISEQIHTKASFSLVYCFFLLTSPLPFPVLPFYLSQSPFKRQYKLLDSIMPFIFSDHQKVPDTENKNFRIIEICVWKNRKYHFFFLAVFRRFLLR